MMIRLASSDRVVTGRLGSARFIWISHQPTGRIFSNADHAIDAAVASLGVVLGRRAMILKDLTEGCLVAPFKVALETAGRFRFPCLQGVERRPQIAAFRDWFISEIEKTAHISDEFAIIPVEKVVIE